jgi:formamidopyrimidine-DNA glycosylase
MPERPDLDYAVPLLQRELQGAEIESTALHKPVVLRLAVEGTLEDALVGRRIESVERHCHFVHFGLSGSPSLEMVISPMLAGRLVVLPAGAKKKADWALALGLSGDRQLVYRDSVQMGKVYVIPQGRRELVPGFQTIGIDVLSAAFTREAFAELAKRRRDQVKVFLLDKTALDSLGNAYADEVLFEAGIHPKTFVRKLGDDEITALHVAIGAVLRRASEEIARRQPATDEKVRDFLNVRGRHKEPCKRCGTPIRKAGVRGYDAYFCPACQPETRKSGIVSWKR